MFAFWWVIAVQCPAVFLLVVQNGAQAGKEADYEFCSHGRVISKASARFPK